MPPTSRMTTYRYRVLSLANNEIEEANVNACYLQEEGSLVMLKGVSHEIVYAVPTHCLMSAERLAQDPQ